MSVDQSLLTSSPTFKTLEEVDSRKLPGRLKLRGWRCLTFSRRSGALNRNKVYYNLSSEKSLVRLDGVCKSDCGWASGRFPSGIPHPHLLGDRAPAAFLFSALSFKHEIVGKRRQRRGEGIHHGIR
jgi:hypothetical protein